MKKNIRKVRNSLLLIILFLFISEFAAIAFALELPKYHIQEEQLDNGFHVLLRYDASASMVAIGLLVGAGIRTEENLIGSGLSHLVEHLVFQGTHETHSSDIAKKIESYGGKMNAFTTPDFTIYYIEIPQEFAMIAVDILTKSILSPAFREEDIAREKGIIGHEMNMGKDDPNTMLNQMLWHNAFLLHPYREKTIGSEILLNALTKEDIEAYYQKWYVPDNMTFIVVGGFHEDTFFPELTQRLLSFPRKPFSPPVTPKEPVRQFTKKHVKVQSDQLTRLMVGYVIPSLNHPDFVALDLLNIILGDGKGSRLYRLLKDQLGLVYQIESDTVGLLDAGMLTISAATSGEHLKRVIDTIDLEIQDVQDGNITQEELDRAKHRENMAYVKIWHSLSGQVWLIGSMYYVTGVPAFIDEFMRQVDKITLSDIQKVAQKYLVGKTISVVGPELKEDSLSVQAPQDHDPQTIVLPNGLQVIIKPENMLPMVVIKVFFLGGLSAEDATTNGVFNLLTKMLADNKIMVSSIESLGGDISEFVGMNSFGLSITVLKDDVQKALHELSILFEEPQLTQDLLVKEKEWAKAVIKDVDDTPLKWAGLELRKLVFQDHPYRYMTVGSYESIAALQIDDVQQAFQQYVVGKNGVLAIFGDVEPEKVKIWLKTCFQSMPSGVYQPFQLPSEKIKDSVFVKGEVNKKIFRSKDQNQSIILIGYRGLRIKDEDRYVIDVIASMLSGFGSPLFETIRNKLGIVYFIGAYHIFGLDPGAFIIYAGTTPESEQIIVDFIKKTMHRICTVPVDDVLLKWAREKYIGEHLRLREKLVSKVELMGLSLLYGLPYDDKHMLRQKVEQITADDIMRVAKKYLDSSLSTTLIVSPNNSEEEA